MTNWHNKLEEKSSWYRAWHSSNFHKVIHWVVFVVAAGFLALITTSNINFLGFSDQVANTPAAGKINKETGFVLIKTNDTALLAKAKTDEGLTEDSTASDQLAKLGIKRFAINKDNNTTGEVVARLQSRLKVAHPKEATNGEMFVEADVLVPPTLIPNDPIYQYAQPEKQSLEPERGWDITTGDPSVTIAIVDSGVDCTHEDLIANCISGWNFYNNNSDY